MINLGNDTRVYRTARDSKICWIMLLSQKKINRSNAKILDGEKWFDDEKDNYILNSSMIQYHVKLFQLLCKLFWQCIYRRGCTNPCLLLCNKFDSDTTMEDALGSLPTTLSLSLSLWIMEFKSPEARKWVEELRRGQRDFHLCVPFFLLTKSETLFLVAGFFYSIKALVL